MRKVIQSTLISLDGVLDDVGSWCQPFFDSAWWENSLNALDACDALLLGRNTYEMLAARTQALLDLDGGAQGSDGPDRAYARRLNGLRKYVFSSTLTSATWNNAVLLNGDAAAQVAELKSQAGKDMMIYGHGPLGEALLKHNLLDEVRFAIHPVLVGRGQVVLRDALQADLRFKEAKTQANGVVVVCYEPLGA